MKKGYVQRRMVDATVGLPGNIREEEKTWLKDSRQSDIERVKLKVEDVLDIMK